MKLPSLMDINLKGKRLLIREDFNVPIKAGQVVCDARIRAALPTLTYAMAQGAKVMVVTHLGRPQFDSKGELLSGHRQQYSLAPVVSVLKKLLHCPVRLVDNWTDQAYQGPKAGCLDLWENSRFLPGEVTNDSTLAKKMASHCDSYVLDAFSAAHREHASTHAVIKAAPIACAGPLLLEELNALEQIMQSKDRPLLAVLGGAKVSTKLPLLRQLLYQVDMLVLGGGIVNTVLAAQGLSIGQSLYDADLLEDASQLLKSAQDRGVSVVVPVDVMVTTATISDLMAQASDSVTIDSLASVDSRICDVKSVHTDEMIVDIGPKTQAIFKNLIAGAKRILWNGAMGVFEVPHFANGTFAITQAIAKSSSLSLAGGGDTLVVIDKLNIRDNFSYVSTGGGAFLNWLESGTLPALTQFMK